MNKNIELIRQKCIEANPAREEQWQTQNGDTQRPCRLADVLLAILAKGPQWKTAIRVESDGQFNLYREPSKQWWCEATWNLLKDDLNEQSEETINFLATLLQ